MVFWLFSSIFCEASCAGWSDSSDKITEVGWTIASNPWRFYSNLMTEVSTQALVPQSITGTRLRSNRAESVRAIPPLKRVGVPLLFIRHTNVKAPHREIWHSRAGWSIKIKIGWNILIYIISYNKNLVFFTLHSFVNEWYEVKRFLNEMYPAFAYKEEDGISIIDSDHWLQHLSKRDAMAQEAQHWA